MEREAMYSCNKDQSTPVDEHVRKDDKDAKKRTVHHRKLDIKCTRLRTPSNAINLLNLPMNKSIFNLRRRRRVSGKVPDCGSINEIIARRLLQTIEEANDTLSFKMGKLSQVPTQKHYNKN